ncbi:hypothetical protein K488DRAFT_88192 [Vararia minispora EC-137]|uniref:Uncharacterized protein n=1 Tax=Vararia minispora EC-137 TaxID=1314806 RepID=A0ACB8QE23_9AGAM|nr:hypothetical protein K488DRAFT_88192 [Vararia minispora EC-137]
MALRRRLEASEGLVHVLSGQVEALKSALGPYCTQDGTPPTNAVTLPLADTHISPAFEPNRRTPPPQQDLTDISSYFPPALTSSPSAGLPLSTPPHTDPLPAPSPPLHARLSSLTVALDATRAAHDALAHDTDTAHAQLGAEIGALRASLGGLRMFVAELSTALSGLRAERAPDDAPGAPHPPLGPGWQGRVYATPPFGPGMIGAGLPLTVPPITTPPAVPFKL